MTSSDILNYAGLVAVLYCAFIMFVMHLTVSNLGSPNGKVERLDLDASSLGLDADSDWARAHGFRWLGVFIGRFGGHSDKIKMAAWQHERDSTYMLGYVVSGRRAGFDFSSQFQDDRGILTGSAPSGMLFPVRLKNPKQIYVTSDLDALWSWHVEAMSLVKGRVGWKPLEFDRPFEDYMIYSVRRTAADIRRRPFWVLRTPWWHLTQRFRCNRHITEEDIRLAESVAA